MAREETTDTDGRDSRSTVGEETGRIGGQADTTDIGERMGLIAGAMEIHPTSHIPKTYICAEKRKHGWR